MADKIANIKIDAHGNAIGIGTLNVGQANFYGSVTIQQFIQEVSLNSPGRYLPEINEFFTGRVGKLAEISRMFEDASEGVVSITQTITGLGGVGKSQLAMAYAYKYAHDHPEAPVWWFASEDMFSSASDFLTSVQFYFDTKDLPTFFRRWCQKNRDWLLVFDNVESHDVIKPWLPGGLVDGKILITTRSAKGFSKHIDLSVFNIEEAMSFLRKRLDVAFDEQDGEELCTRLGCFPLALEQACAYINTVDSWTVGEYLMKLNQFGLRLLEKGRPCDYPEVVTTTWNIMMERLSQTARHLLNIFIYFAPENLPLGYDELPYTDIFPDELDFYEGLSELKQYAIIDSNHNIHRLLQEVIRATMNDSTTVFINIGEERTTFFEGSEYLNQAISLLAFRLDADLLTADGRAMFAKLAKHAESVAEYASANSNHILELLNNLGIKYKEIGDYFQSSKALSRALCLFERINEKNSGSFDSAIAHICNQLGHTLLCLTKYKDAMHYFQRSLEFNVKTYGAYSINSAMVSLDIARVHLLEGDYEKALHHANLSLFALHNIYGCVHHRGIAAAFDISGSAHLKMQEYEKAFSSISAALKIQQEMCGDDDSDQLDLATAYNSMGMFFVMTDAFHDALATHIEALKIRERVLGLFHPNTAISYNNVGLAYHGLGQYEDSLIAHKKALEIRTIVLGEKHVDTLASFSNIGLALKGLDRFTEALEYLEKALLPTIKIIGISHPEVPLCIFNYALTLFNAERYLDAKINFARANVLFKKCSGEGHPNTKLSAGWIGESHKADGGVFNEWDWLWISALLRDADEWVASWTKQDAKEGQTAS